MQKIMSAAFWVSFFRDAGIPYSLAKSYASTFEENRIGKDMLLDLDKEILADMGIKVMGDVIGILKHAKKEARKDSTCATVSGTSSKHKSSSAVHSTQSAPQAPAVSTTSSPLHHHSEEEYLGDVGLMEYPEEREQEHLPLEEHNLQESEPEYRTLQSDLIQQVVAVVTQQQQQQQQQVQQRGETEDVKQEGGDVVNPALLGMEDEFQEEYVTEAYKRRQQKRALGTLYSDSAAVFPEVPQSKQPRLIILPQEDLVNNVGRVPEDLLPSPPLSSETSSRRLLEAAGLVKRGEHIHAPPSEKPAVSSSASVFSRLDGKGRVSPQLKTYLPPPPASSTPPPQPSNTRTVVTGASPSPQKLGLRVTARDGRRISTAAISSGARSNGPAANRGGGVVKRSKRESSGRGLVSSSSSFTSKEPIKSRLGVREHGGGGGGGYGGSESWTEVVSTSSHSGRSTTRLVGGHRESTSSTNRRNRRTMVADSASTPPPKASSRLGTGHKSSSSSSPFSALVSSATRPRGVLRGGPKVKTSPSMKADEYEMKRQLDIRSRLAAKEKEVEERRRGPLRGRLGQHHVFQRLT